MSELQGRKRSKFACKTCRELKRKCDGSQPCSTCTRFEYECTYGKIAGSKRTHAPRRVAPSTVSPPVQPAPIPPPENAGSTVTSPKHLRSLEANSGAAFLRRLALRLDPKNAPRMHTFAWNAFLGARKSSTPPTSRSITDMLSKAEMQDLANVYFQKIDPIYGFVDLQDVEQQIANAWEAQSAQPMSHALLCGIAAIGFLYSTINPLPVEFDLVESARVILERAISETPSVTSITAWILRATYLRVAGTHHVAWMASCILMHMVEAAGIHAETYDEYVIPATGEEVDPDLRRRIVAVAQHLNIWMSFDMGRSRVRLCNTTLVMPSARPGDYTVELMELLPYSAQLDPEREPDASELEAALSAVLDRVHSSPPSILAQVNLALCLCRRLQSMNMSFTGGMSEKLLSLTTKGIESAQALLDDRAPWHHMANVPFQIVCILLSIDTLASISQLKQSMNCLSNVAAIYDTDATREALKTASLLILLHQRWKEKSALDLADVLKLYPVNPVQDAQNSMPAQEPERWLDSLENDLYGLQYPNIDQFFTSEFLWNTQGQDNPAGPF